MLLLLIKCSAFVMKQAVFVLTLIFLFSSCARENKFPTRKTQKVSDEMLNIVAFDSEQNLQANNSFQNIESPANLQQLFQSFQQYNDKNEAFSFQTFKDQWENCRVSLNTSELEGASAEMWVEITGLLLQLTAEAKYAQELETVFLNSTNRELQNLAASYSITKSADHLHLNLFIPAEIEYDHSLGGHVKMVTESNYPQTGRVELHMDSEKKRYIELYIRIPDWASDAMVTVKGVKYFAPAGGYCKIAKQWREGDLVEIVFPGIRNRTVS